MIIKASDYIADFFASKGIDVIFGYIGGMVTHLIDSFDKNQKLRFIQTYHEQTAAIAAEGYALEKGLPGVAIATSGPGATNLMTGIADAYFGSIPTIFITGQVNTYEYKYDKPIRQQGFQETDVVNIVTPITKYAVLVDKASDLRYELEKAYAIAMDGRKGPVLIDLPMDISRAEIDPSTLKSYESPLHVENPFNVLDVKELIENSKRPMVLLGGGCQGYFEEITDFLRGSGIPFVTSLMGRGCADETLSTYVGMVGSYGNRCANIAISQCDLLIVLGSRLDTRQTGARIDAFMPTGKIIHVDIDNSELECHRLNNRVKINTSVSTFIKTINSGKIAYPCIMKWVDWVTEIVAKYNQSKEIERFVENKAPYRLFEEFNEVSEENAVITADIGQNQMWAAQTIRLKKGQRFITSGGLAPMGFSLPAAIGAAFASPDKVIYCFNGDGGLHMACQSLLLISQYDLNIKVIVLNNEALGMITQFQHLYFRDNMAATTETGGYLVPNLKALAVAYNMPYTEIDTTTLKKTLLKKVLTDHKDGYVRFKFINFKIHGLTTVSPKLEYNRPIYDASPYLNEGELEIPMWG